MPTPPHGAVVEDVLVLLGRASAEQKRLLTDNLAASVSAQGTVTRYEFRRALTSSKLKLDFRSASVFMDWLGEPIEVADFWQRLGRLEAFERADTNGDGVLSRAEASAHPPRILEDDMDTNGDVVPRSSALKIGASSVAKAPAAPEERLSAVEELHRTRKPSYFTPTSGNTVDTFMHKYYTNSANGQSSTAGGKRLALPPTTETGAPSIAATPSSAARPVHTSGANDSETPGTILPASVTKAVDAAIAHGVRRPTHKDSAAPSLPALVASSSSSTAPAPSSSLALITSSSQQPKIGDTALHEAEEENHLLYARLHRSGMENARLEREVSDLKELLLKAQGEGTMKAHGAVPLSSDTPAVEAAEQVVDLQRGTRGREALVKGITQIITRLRSETLRREVAENAVALSSRNKAVGAPTNGEAHDDNDSSSVFSMRAELERATTTASILEDKLEGAESALKKEKAARAEAEKALAAAISTKEATSSASGADNDSERSAVLTAEVRETLLGLKEQVLAEQKRREVIDTEVRTLRAALLRCKEEVIVERERLRAQAETLLQRERSVLGSLVEQLESARSESTKMDDYAGEMEKVHAALRMLQNSLRLEDGDAHAGAAVPKIARGVSPSSTTSRAGDVQWPAIAEAVPESALALQNRTDKNGGGGEDTITVSQAGGTVDGDDDAAGTAAIIEALTGLRSEISSLLPQ